MTTNKELWAQVFGVLTRNRKELSKFYEFSGQRDEMTRVAADEEAATKALGELTRRAQIGQPTGAGTIEIEVQRKSKRRY